MSARKFTAENRARLSSMTDDELLACMRLRHGNPYMNLTTAKELRPRAEALAERLRAVPGVLSARAVDDTAYVGGGSLPDQSMKTCVVEIEAREVSDAERGRVLDRRRPGVPADRGHPAASAPMAA